MNESLLNQDSCPSIDSLKDLLGDNFVSVERAVHHHKQLISTATGSSFSVRDYESLKCSSNYFIVEIKDGVLGHYILRHSAFKILRNPYYCEFGLLCELKDDHNNFYLMKEASDILFNALL